MDVWAIFAWITAALDTPLRTAVDGEINRLFPPILTALAAGMTIWIAFLGYKIALGKGGDNAIGAMLSGFIFAAAVGAAITASVYHNDVEAVALDLPNTVGTFLAGGPVTGNSFDQMLGRAMGGGARVLEMIGSSWSISNVLLKAVVFVFLAGAGVCIAAGYAVWMVSRVALYLVIGIGPLFLPLFLFSFFRSYFDRFVGVVISIIVAQILIAVLASTMIDAEIGVLGQLATAPAGGGDNPYPVVALLLGMGLVFFICWKLLKEIPGIATALIGGGYMGAAARAGAAVQSRVSGLVGSTAGAAGRAVSPTQATQAVRRAANRPPGQAL